VSLVIDSSITLAWIFDDETSRAVQYVLDRVIEEGAWVPALWRLEVGNVLELSVRRGRISSSIRNEALTDLQFMPISVDIETDQHAWGSTLQLAERHKLTLYDATYLDLAIRRHIPLASLDGQLIKAARAEGIEVLGI
jgi:predicted nucleic acid-binding protein